VFWVDAREATLAGVAGELGAQLGLRLPGELASNLEGIRRVADRYRCLVVLEGASPEAAREFATLGHSSVLFADAAAAPMTLEAARGNLQRLSTWIGNPSAAPGSGAIWSTIKWLTADASRWDLARSFASAALSWYKFHERFAEAFEIADLVAERALKHQDREALTGFGRERAWICENWGRPAEAAYPFPAAAEPMVQLALW
jgi:hypothetical protein